MEHRLGCFTVWRKAPWPIIRRGINKPVLPVSAKAHLAKARDAGEKAKRAAADTASTMGDEVKTILDRQLGTGATMAGQFASSIRIAADDLSRESPMLAGLVRGFADRVDGYAQDLQDQTVDQVMKAASDFTRKQPALVFGLAALAGFFVLRTFKSAGEKAAPSIQPSQDPMQPRDYNG
jgi:hypothetical protein